jgi:two-component system chemotaxis sensor kinase CheA
VQLDDEVREFLIECNENLINLDQEIVLLEQNPTETKLIDSVFRTFHTIKGTCGFFGFATLGSLTHVAENLIDQMRSRQRILTPELAALLLESVDAIKKIVALIETTGEEGDETHKALHARLTASLENKVFPPPRQESAEVFQEQAAGEPASGRVAIVQDSTIRVDVGLLDKLMNLVGELVLARNQLLQSATRHDVTLLRTVQRLNAITSELQEGVLKTRMQPIGVIWNKLPRLVRDLAAECSKRIRIEMEGAETELDKTIIEAIKDPLTHIVRNACDHGIEQPAQRAICGKPEEGLVLLRAYHEGGHVNIEISDDGKGLDPEKIKSRAVAKGLLTAEQAVPMSEREAINLVFAPGFSTAEQVTSISGRGVGMDVVKTNIQKIGGIVDIGNRPGSPGSRVKITIPLTLAIIPGLVIRANSNNIQHRFIIPQANLLELVRLDLNETREGERAPIEYVNGTPVYRRRGQLLPLTYLNRVLGMEDRTFPADPVINIVVLQAEGRPFGLIVDGIFDTQEIVVKPLGKRLKGLSSYLGATIMGDGHVALILDIPGLAHLAGMASQAREVRRLDATSTITAEPRETFLIFRAGTFHRVAVPLTMVSRLEQIEARNIEHAAGHPVLHYRGQILTLVELGSLLDPTALRVKRHPSAATQVIVLGRDESRLGILVDQIVDIVEETITFRTPTSRKGLCGSVILGTVVTDLLDAEGLLAQANHPFPMDAADGKNNATLKRIA